LRQLFEEYKNKNGKPIEDSIKSEMSGNLCKSYLALSIKKVEKKTNKNFKKS
jgi:hypothetical protein